MSRAVKTFAALLLAAALAPAFAAPAKKNNADVLRPTGPVTITADRAEWSKTGVMVYTGNVSLVSEKMKMNGNRLELTQFPESQYTAKITGDQAHLEHAGEPTEKGEPTPTVTADASTLLYDSRTSVVDVIGNAKMTRGKDEVTGSNIRYNVAERRIQATGGDAGQVKIVIQPPPDKKLQLQKAAESKAAEIKAPESTTPDAKPAVSKPAENTP
ncbi:lipopolysaccharide transport periplasmic protein LptA [Stenotrophobium rhamnosiphilum]|nr:lipopolysaccharide transport periplasmic protein LptA [Stenotrophobium rhamnosiphilum]